MVNLKPGSGRGELDTSDISCCFDEESQDMLRDYRKNGLGHTSVAIANALISRGVAGSTVLEVGCGFGALMVELVRKGATAAVGVDLSPRMLELARSLAKESGVSGSVSFEEADAAVSDLVTSDMVILDTVLCCYPDYASLLENSSSAAKKYYALSVPDDRRLATRFFRVLLPLQGLVFRRNNFRFFIHPTTQIRRRLESRGFRLVATEKAGWIWSVFLFAAPGAP